VGSEAVAEKENNAMSDTAKAKRFVKKNGLNYECQRERHRKGRLNYGFWRCGQCLRGKMMTWDRECAVCHAKVVPA
jgi:hypothetical protein